MKCDYCENSAKYEALTVEIAIIKLCESCYKDIDKSKISELYRL